MSRNKVCSVSKKKTKRNWRTNVLSYYLDRRWCARLRPSVSITLRLFVCVHALIRPSQIEKFNLDQSKPIKSIFSTISSAYFPLVNILHRNRAFVWFGAYLIRSEIDANYPEIARKQFCPPRKLDLLCQFSYLRNFLVKHKF